MKYLLHWASVFLIENGTVGPSLVVQRLGLDASKAGAQVRSLVRELDPT